MAESTRFGVESRSRLQPRWGNVTCERYQSSAGFFRPTELRRLSMTPFVGSTYCREGLQDSSGAAPRGYPPQSPARVCVLRPRLATIAYSHFVRQHFIAIVDARRCQCMMPTCDCFEGERVASSFRRKLCNPFAPRTTIRVPTLSPRPTGKVLRYGNHSETPTRRRRET